MTYSTLTYFFLQTKGKKDTLQLLITCAKFSFLKPTTSAINTYYDTTVYVDIIDMCVVAAFIHIRAAMYTTAEAVQAYKFFSIIFLT